LQDIEKLIEYGKFFEASNWFKKNDLLPSFSKKEHFKYRILQCDVLNGLRQSDKALPLIDGIITELVNENLKFELVQAYITKSTALEQLIKYYGSFDIVSKGFSVLKSMPNKNSDEYKLLKGLLHKRKASTYYQIGSNNKMMSNAKKALKIFENLNDTSSIALSLSLLGLGYGHRSQHNKSLEFLHESLIMFQELKNEYQSAIIYHYLARKYYMKGEPIKALEYMNKSLPIIRHFGDDYRVCVTLVYLIPILIEKGDYEVAKKYAKQCLILLEKLGYREIIGKLYYHLIRIALFQEDFHEANINLEILYSLREEYNIPHYFYYHYQFAHALILKSSNQLSDIAKAEGILREIMRKKNIEVRLTFEIRYYLCELLLHEFQSTTNSRILNEVDFLSKQILNSGKKNGFVWLQLKAYNLRLLSLFIQEQNNPGSINTREVDTLIDHTQELTNKFGLKTVQVQFSQQYFELMNYNL